jgi:hypothetical protein
VEGVLRGNAYVDAVPYAGWLVGHFVEPATSLRATGDVEVKWDVHPAGHARSTWVEADERTALCVLLRGRLRLRFGDGDVLLAEEGDYAMWHGVGHTWSVEEDCVAVVVRWPSVAGYAPDGVVSPASGVAGEG